MRLHKTLTTAVMIFFALQSAAVSGPYSVVMYVNQIVIIILFSHVVLQNSPEKSCLLRKINFVTSQTM